MSVVLASVIGFLHSFIPNIFDIFQDKRDKQQELAIMQLQLERERIGTAAKEQEILVQSQAQVMQTLYQTANTPTGIRWLDAMNALVRPAMAYLIVIDYVLVTYLAYVALMSTSMALSPTDIVSVLWTNDDRDLFAVITAFYFGSRINGKA